MKTRRYIPALLAALLFALAAVHANAQACPSSGLLTDASGNVTTCTPTNPATATPPPASTPGNGGIFSCSAPGASSIAASSAIGGTYVPVYDAAVALNTGTLTYEECVLKELANQQKQAVSVAYVQQEYNQLSSGRNGNPYWVVNYAADQGKVAQNAVTQTYQSGVYSAINPAFQNQVTTAVLRNYQYETQAPQDALACPYQGDWSAAIGQPTQNFSWGAIFALADPACDPVYAYTAAQNIRDTNVAAAESEWLNRLNWNNGIYDVTDANGNVVVPGTFLNAVGTQALTSGYRQLENANDIGQMVGRYFTGIGSYLLSGPSSVADVQQYIGKAVQEQQNTLSSSVVSTALTNLYQIINWEQQYNSLQEQMAGVLSGAVTQLRSAETKCWELIQQNVCTGTASTTPTGANQCIGQNGAILTVATSTAFSNAVISSANFAALATTLSSNIDTSNKNLALLNAIATAVQSSDSATRNTGLQQLDVIINANPPVLHTQSTITATQDQLQQLQSAINDPTTGIVTTAINRWAGNDAQGGMGTIGWNGNPSSDTGWCNVSVSGSPSSAQQQTITNWTTAWTTK